MKIKNLVNIWMYATLAVPAIASAQAVNVDHYSSKGYTQTTYFSAPGTSGMFTVNQSTVVSGKPQPVFTAYANASVFLPGGRFIVYVPTAGEATGWVNSSNPALKTPGSGEALIPARRMEYQLGLGGIQLISMVEGALSAGSTLQDPAFTDRTFDHDHYEFSLPGLGMLFAVHGNYTGKIGFEPTGVGGMSFIPTNGAPEVLFAPGTPVNSASWMGWLHSSDTTVVRN